MTWMIKLIMFICVVPTVILILFLGFPKDPEKRKMIFGVRDNEKFHEADASRKVLEIARGRRKEALIIAAAVILASIILLILPATDITLLAWILLVFVLFAIAVPYGRGNTELKNLKKELGITKSGTVYADLRSAGVTHSLKMPWLILPNAIALAGTVFAVLVDLGAIKIFRALPAEKYALTMMSMSFAFIGVIIVPIAYIMDNARNTVISKDSNINSNYNRAKKKTWADLWIAMSWVNALFLISYDILMIFVYNDTIVLAGMIVYTLLIMIIVAIGAKNSMAIERRYERDTDLELLDDDDCWIWGMFYYNTNDTRLNVEKRFGYGGTINMAHPAGKIIAILSALLIVFSIIYIVWLAATGQLDPSNV